MNPLISPARSHPAARSGGSIEFGITQLVNGQAYIDVVLTTYLSTTIWDTVCSVVNTDDATPLNIWPGIITAKSTTGFTVQLNGAPNSNRYFLHWAIIPGAAAPAIVATDYLLSGPSSGAPAVVSTPFTVQLRSGQTVPAPVTVTPHDGGGGGTFTPTSVLLVAGVPVHFTYTAASGGVKTISVTNNGGLTDPASLTYTAALFDPTTIAGLEGWWKADAITAGSLFLGALKDREKAEPMPAGVDPKAAPPDGALISTWLDSSGNGNALINGGGAERPTFKTNIVNGLPVVRFDGVANTMTGSTDMGIVQPDTIFIVTQQPTLAVSVPFCSNAPQMIQLNTSGNLLLYAGAAINDAIDHHGAFHVLTAKFAPAGTGTGYVDGVQTCTGSVGSNPMQIIGIEAFSGVYYPGDVAEILVYNSSLSTTDRQNVENYLKGKYGIA